MSRPRSEQTAHNKIQAHVTDEDLVAIDDWRFGCRIGSRSEAIRQLIELGLAASRAGWKPEEPEDGAGGDS